MAVPVVLWGALLALLALLLVRYAARALRAAWRTARMFWLARHIPGPRGWPPIGSFLRFAGPQDELVDKACATQREFGDTVRLWAGPVLSITVLDPVDLEVVFSNPSLQSKPDLLYEALSPIIGRGLVTLSGDEHRRHRKVITPSLHMEILKDFVPTFDRNATRICAELDKLAASGAEFDAVPFMGRFSAYSICETVFSSDFSGMEQDKEEFTTMLMTGSELMFYRAIRPWFNSDLLFKLSIYHDAYRNSVKVSEEFVTKMLEFKQQQIKLGKAQTDRKRKAFLDHILGSSDVASLTKRELLEELKTLSGAAVATSMDSLSCFMKAMSLLPDVQSRIVQELEDVFGGSDRPLEYQDLPHLQYLECVLKETLRLFPPVFTFSRVAQQDVLLPSGYVLPEGCNVAILPYVTHRNPKHFVEPDKFDPSRFLPENSRGRHPFAFIPFSAGSRNCIGQRYAMMAGKTFAAEILRRFRILPADDGITRLDQIKLVAGVSMAPKDGAKIRLERRPRNEQRG